MIDQILEVTTFKCYPETSWMEGIKENVAKILKINDQKQKKTRVNCIIISVYILIKIRFPLGKKQKRRIIYEKNYQTS